MTEMEWWRKKKEKERERREKVNKDEREWIKNFFFLAFSPVLLQNATVLFTCGKNYEIWNI